MLVKFKKPLYKRATKEDDSISGMFIFKKGFSYEAIRLTVKGENFIDVFDFDKKVKVRLNEKDMKRYLEG